MGKKPPFSPEPLPILVGLTGKRKLLGQDDRLRDCLDAIFLALETAFPHSPKVLVTGLAEGADILATERVLLRSGWLAHGLIPLELNEFRSKFVDPEALGRLDYLLRHPKLMARTLKPLALSRPGVRDPAIAPPVSESSLHYEQLGLWLAEHTTILIAVRLKDEVADKVGGTMRVVNHRLCNPEPSMDAVAVAVIKASQELTERSALDRVVEQPVWMVELSPASDAATSLPHAIHPLHGHDGSHTAASQDQANPITVRERFPHAADLDEYNRLIGGRQNLSWQRPPRDVASCLDLFRKTLSEVQGGFQSYWRWAIISLAGLFVVAIVALEAFAKLAKTQSFAYDIALKSWAMPLYVTLIAACIAIFLWARQFKWQNTHEDYRAANEVLRTQRAFCHAGMNPVTDRADRHYLLGTSGSLMRVRRGAGAVITWVLLSSAATPTDWRMIYGQGTAYVDGQQGYFRNRAIKRRRWLYLVEVSSWFCFAASFGMACWLAALFGGASEIAGWVAAKFRAQTEGYGYVFAWVFAACAFVVRTLSPVRAWSGWQTAIPAMLAGGLMIAPAMYDLGCHLGLLHKKE